jgi:hypothetical protein
MQEGEGAWAARRKRGRLMSRFNHRRNRLQAIRVIQKVNASEKRTTQTIEKLIVYMEKQRVQFLAFCKAFEKFIVLHEGNVPQEPERPAYLRIVKPESEHQQ